MQTDLHPLQSGRSISRWRWSFQATALLILSLMSVPKAVGASPSWGLNETADLTFSWPQTGVRMELQFFTSAEKNAPTMACPPELMELAKTCGALPEAIVFDPGHAEAGLSNRSDLTTWDDPFQEASGREGESSPYIKPTLEHIAKASERPDYEDRPARHARPETHEGNFNLSISLMKKFFIDRCFVEKRNPQASSPVVLTRHPGEEFYGEYAEPNWVQWSAPQAVTSRQLFMPILSEVKSEILTTYPQGSKIHPGLGGSLASRVAYINRLLGSSRPWAFRLTTREEEASGQNPPEESYRLRDLRRGVFVSHHHDTTPARAPADAKTKAVFEEKFRSIRARFLEAKAKGEEGRILELRDEWYDFFYNQLKLRSRDISSVFVPLVAMPQAAPAERDYLQGPPPKAPPFAPNIANTIRQALESHFLSWAPIRNHDPRAVVTTFASSLAVLSGAVQTRTKILVESAQLTGQAADEMVRQVRQGDRTIVAKVSRDHGHRHHEVRFTDGQILNAKAQAIGLLRGLCGK